MLWPFLAICLSWKSLSLLLAGLFIIHFTWTALITDASPPALDSREAYNVKNSSSTGAIETGLTAQQCVRDYPDLYHGLDRAVALWRDKQHRISAEDVGIAWRRDAALRVLIHDNELRILETKGVHGNDAYRQRALSVLSLIQRALWSASAGGEHLPTIEASIVVDDMSLLDGDPATDTRSTWTFATNRHDANHKRHWLIPNFSMYSAPGIGSFQDMRQLAQQHDADFSAKIPKAVWRGVKWTNENLRGALLDATDGRNWADVAVVDWNTRKNMMPMDENCAYAFTVYTEGRSYSGRLPFLLNCNSLPLIHPLDWRTYFDHLLIPKGRGQNYVPVRRDFGDMESTVKYYLTNPEEAQRIVQNMVDTFRSRYTTSPAISCYLRRLILAYGSVSYTPEVMQPPAEDGIARHRGVSFEEFVHLDRDFAET